MKILKHVRIIVLWAVVLFLLYHAVRIYLVTAVKPPPRGGAEVYRYADGSGHNMAFFFLPDHKIIIAFENQGKHCYQFIDQTNHAGRKLFGDFYYLEDSGVFLDYLKAPSGYKPFLYELKTLSVVGDVCEDFPKIGKETRLILYFGEERLIYYDKTFTMDASPNLSRVNELLEILEAATPQ